MLPECKECEYEKDGDPCKHCGIPCWQRLCSSDGRDYNSISFMFQQQPAVCLHCGAPPNMKHKCLPNTEEQILPYDENYIRYFKVLKTTNIGIIKFEPPSIFGYTIAQLFKIPEIPYLLSYNYIKEITEEEYKKEKNG